MSDRYFSSLPHLPYLALRNKPKMSKYILIISYDENIKDRDYGLTFYKRRELKWRLNVLINFNVLGRKKNHGKYSTDNYPRN